MELLPLARAGSVLARRVPRPLNTVELVVLVGLVVARGGQAAGGQGGFEGVRFPGEIAFAFVFYGADEVAADDGGGLGELDVGRAVPEPNMISISAQRVRTERLTTIHRSADGEE